MASIGPRRCERKSVRPKAHPQAIAIPARGRAARRGNQTRTCCCMRIVNATMRAGSSDSVDTHERHHARCWDNSAGSEDCLASMRFGHGRACDVVSPRAPTEVGSQNSWALPLSGLCLVGGKVRPPASRRELSRKSGSRLTLDVSAETSRARVTRIRRPPAPAATCMPPPGRVLRQHLRAAADVSSLGSSFSLNLLVGASRPRTCSFAGCSGTAGCTLRADGATSGG